MEDQIIKEGEFEYIEKGEGPVILALHGLFGALSNFNDLFTHFSKKYKVVIPIMPIYTLPVINTSVKSLNDYVSDFIKFKGYKKVNLLGNSLGGHVGLVYTSQNLDKVASLILTGSSGLYENAFGGSYPKKGDKAYIREKIDVTFYDPKHTTDELVEECYELVNDRNKLIRILALAKSAIRHNMAKELPNLKIPTCLIWGRNDKITPPKVAEEFQELLPNADLYWIDKCGHAPMMEQPTEFNNIMDTWLTKLYPEVRLENAH